MHPLLADLRHAFRLLRKSPAFTITACLSLAIGIAASTAVFGVADALLLRARTGIADPGRLVDIGRTVHRGGFDTISYASYADYRDRNTVFTGVAAYRIEPQPLSLEAGGRVERIYGTLVSDSYFSVLGVRAARGRLFLPGEDRPPEARRLAIISHRLWQSRFDGDPAVIGATIRLNTQPVTVVGVADAGFSGTSVLSSDVWLPLSMQSALSGASADMFTNRRIVWLMAFARLKPGVALGQAQAAMDALASQLARDYPDVDRNAGVRVAASHRLPGQLRTPVTLFIVVLSALVSLVLLIACSNVAGMLLARAAARGKEIAVRLAIGSGRGRLVRQLLTETLVLFLLGGAGGVLGAAWMISLLEASLPNLPVPLLLDIRLDPRVLSFALALSLGTGLVFGLLPALQASRASVLPMLHGDPSASRIGRLRLRGGFVAAQVAMSLVLLVATGLFLRALGRAGTIDAGFNPAGVETVFLDLKMGGYMGETAPVFMRTLLQRLSTEPGVGRVAMAGVLPMGGDGLSFGSIRVPGARAGGPSDGGAIDADWNVIAGDYFGILQLPLLRGRAFTDADAFAPSRVAIINQTLASRLWPGEDPLGRTFETDGPDRKTLQVVGVARDAKYRWIGDHARAFVYVPYGQEQYQRQTLLVRGTGGSALPAVRKVLHELNAALPIIQTGTLSEYADQGLLPQRLAAWIAGGLGVVGLLLSALGIYGVTSYDASRRAREIGIRIALGAEPGGITRLVVWRGVRLALVGGILGLAGAVAVSRLAAALLLGIGPMDPVAFAAGALVLLLTMVAASYLPARAAARRNPVEALRAE